MVIRNEVTTETATNYRTQKGESVTEIIIDYLSAVEEFHWAQNYDTGRQVVDAMVASARSAKIVDAAQALAAFPT